jgi:protocatechuate 3,4-dioxygenase beta subunit
MMLMRFALSGFFLALVLAISPAVSAYDPVVDDILHGADCMPTPEIKDMPYYPDKAMGRTNNLRRDTGLATVAKGEPIYIIGHVVDENCVPIEDALVEMWQANAYGKYDSPDDKSDKLRDENFIGSGVTRTDNLGEFKFLTIFPGQPKPDMAPRVHFRIYHSGFNDGKVLGTEMYFPEQPANEHDSSLESNPDRFNQLLASTRYEAKDGSYKLERASGDAVYFFKVALKGTNKFKKY